MGVGEANAQIREKQKSPDNVWAFCMVGETGFFALLVMKGTITNSNLLFCSVEKTKSGVARVIIRIKD